MLQVGSQNTVAIAIAIVVSSVFFWGFLAVIDDDLVVIAIAIAIIIAIIIIIIISIAVDRLKSSIVDTIDIIGVLSN